VRAETSISKPAVPEFTVKLVDRSYDVPSSSSIDPYTGQIVIHPGYHVENKTIEVTIKNQPFIPTNIYGWNTSFYYNVRIKGHYADDWIALYPPADNPLKPSNSDYTTLSLTQSYPSNAQIDFQVEAMIGYVSHTTEFASWYFTGEESGWSNTQTITIGESQTPTSPPANSPTPSSESLQTEITTIVGVVIALAAIGAGLGLLIYLIRRK
jgi:hypothetical protein